MVVKKDKMSQNYHYVISSGA